MISHPLRWKLLSALTQGDHRVRELVAIVGEPQNLVSYHLGLLRKGGLVSTRRSSFDGRDSYNRLELGTCAQAFSEAAGALHPAMRAGITNLGGTTRRRRSAPQLRILFLCTGNSSRSPIAAALMRFHAGNQVKAFSAGSSPKALNPRASRSLLPYGIDLVDHQPTSLTGFVDRKLHYVISLCDRVREGLPEFSSRPTMLHWSTPNPDDDGRSAAFQRTAADLDRRVLDFLPTL